MDGTIRRRTARGWSRCSSSARAARARQYLGYKETGGRHFLDPLFAYLRRRGIRDLRVLEVGCSFGHITEYLAEQPLVREIATFDTDPAFAAMVRVKVE